MHSALLELNRSPALVDLHIVIADRAQWIVFCGRLGPAVPGPEALRYRVEGPDSLRLVFALRPESLLKELALNLVSLKQVPIPPTEKQTKIA